jgi:ATP-dependent Clp protease, protease subunit
MALSIPSSDPTKSTHSFEDEDAFDMMPSKYQGSLVELAKDRILFMTEDFSKQVASEMTAWLLRYNQLDKVSPIYIYIHSQGGDASAMMNIIDVINMIDAPVHTVCLGRAYSAGAFLLASGSKRMAFPSSEIMVHSAQLLFPIPGKEGAVDSQDYGKFVQAFDNKVMRILAAACKKGIKQVKKDCETDMFLTAPEALAYGIIDEILE